jgi:hypothetical protein
MPSSLIPEKPLTISPSLAATIGLEEAVMLHTLHERMRFSKASIVDGYKWFAFDQHAVEESFPFWQAGDIQRVANSLKDKGVILLAPEPYLLNKTLKIALNEKVVAAVERIEAKETIAAPITTLTPPTIKPAAQTTSSTAGGGGARVINANWQPDTEILKQIQQLGIPASFANECLAEFVRYWAERNEAHHGWASKFQKWVIRRWREEETVFASSQRSKNLSDEWYPSEDAFEVLQKGGVNRAFIEDAVAEFILYWRERGESSNTWNSKFVQHVRHQWARFSNALQYDTEPRLITADWQPSADVFDILRLANIDPTFARQLVPEFVLFWRDAKQLHNSWNSKFLQHVKYHWAKRHHISATGHAKTAEQDFVTLHTDRSWADGL